MIFCHVHNTRGVAWRQQRFRFGVTPEVAEALAAREAMILARRMAWRNIVVEGDSQVFFLFLGSYKLYLREMEEVGAQVAAPIPIHQTLPGRFCSTLPTAKKRGLPFNSTSLIHQNPSDNWNPKSWDWDSTRFVARPLQCDGARVGSGSQFQPAMRKEVQSSAPSHSKPDRTGGYDENLLLKLGDGSGSSSDSGGMNSVEEPQPVTGSNKRMKPGSSGGANYPMCQVDNCKEDLSTGKDYHRRHKVCEVHSKAGRALVGKQMQRFCQQCSRFHPLSEFDEGKRSCRRRLAGHNRRRRKTQPEDSTPPLLVPGSRDNNAGCDMDIINLLTVLARAQGNNEDMSGKLSLVPDKDQLIQILSKINSLPLPANIAAKLPLLKSTNGNIHNLVPSGNQNLMSGNDYSPSTMDLLAVLSAAPGAPPLDTFESGKSKSPRVDQAACLNLQRGSRMEFPPIGGERSSTTYQSPMEEVDCQVQETSPSLSLQLYNSSPEVDSARKLPLGRNYLSSESSNPSQERSPVSSPPLVHDLFPMQTSRDTRKDDYLSNSEGEIAYVKETMSNGCSTSLQLFGETIRATKNGSIQTSPYQIGCTSSGSDHSPSSLNSDPQDRTGRIIFKLFDKDPSQLPGSLRTQIFNWLSNSPSEMESYIRPGCIVLSLYLSMPSVAWDQLEQNLLHYVRSLVNDIDVDFWGNGRFLVQTDKQMASHKDGKIRLCKSLRAWSTPELISVSPVAVVSGQETCLVLKGRSLKAPDTKINCTHTDGYGIREVPASSSQDATYDEIILSSFKVVNGVASNMLGRFFIEVENGFRGSSFPVIVADNTICQELRLLQPEIDGIAEISDGIPSDEIQNTDRPRSREEVLHFLDELGWLFQRKHNSSLFGKPDYRLSRFKFLLLFSVERDFCALVRTLLDILLELNLGREALAKESLEMLSEIHLLNRAVKRRSRSMVNLLIHYSIIDPADSSVNFIFVPNMAGPGGITPLHLAACTSSSDDVIDALTSDPHEIGLNSWNSIVDANGLSPYAYALMRNHHSYNALVSQKLADKENGQVSISIKNEIEQFQVEVNNKDKKTISHFNQTQKSCSKCCAVAAYGYSKKFGGSQGLLQRPYIHSMLVIAAVCVCVCVFLRGHPYVGCVSPFAWENLDFGAM
ncbi:hypothetical protein BUALT_Bualt08G0001600 [Buddleja alternifolia]|uniref:SBP-type domain-containing protein n=1 Tax=Buddleja alternifolia TaxID=168488 RepID=A0AAV6XDG6_9LAMI|nr:hypothetical protein BUALT_Bualt08G0001600 [Buddleja alternifolia]